MYNMNSQIIFAVLLLVVYLLRPEWLVEFVNAYHGRLIMFTIILIGTYLYGIISGLMLLGIYVVSSQVLEGNDPKAKVPPKKKKAGRVDTEDKIRQKSDPKLKEDPKANIKQSKKSKVNNSLSPIKEGFSLLY